MAINTLALLRTAAKEEADKENDPHISDTEWRRRINEGYRSLWSLVRSENEEWFVSKVTATCVSASNNVLNVALSGQRLRALWYVTGSGPDDYERVRRWNMEEIPDQRSYKIMGSGVIYIYPSSLAVGTYTMWREQAFLELVADGDTIDGTLLDWAEYIYLYAAVGGKGKEESDASLLGQRLGRLEKEILAFVSDLDASEPARVVNVSPAREWRPPPLPRP